MPCCAPRTIVNPHYKKVARDNDEDVELYNDRPDYYIDVDCGVCINCVKKRGNTWRLRLLDEWRYMSSDAQANSFFVTLTVAPRYYREALTNPRSLIKKFLDRIRKEYGSTPRHWITTEFGEEKGRLHYHGLFFDVNFDIFQLEDYWKYGFTDVKYLTTGRVAYITKYITKFLDDDVILPQFKQRVFTSPGMGKAYVQDPYNLDWHNPAPGEYLPIYLTDNNYIVGLPKYYRSKLFTDVDRDIMKEAYFANLSPDVIPDTPLSIGKVKYDDYTLWLADCQLIKAKVLEYYPYHKKVEVLDDSTLSLDELIAHHCKERDLQIKKFLEDGL